MTNPDARLKFMPRKDFMTNPVHFPNDPDPEWIKAQVKFMHKRDLEPVLNTKHPFYTWGNVENVLPVMWRDLNDHPK